MTRRSRTERALGALLAGGALVTAVAFPSAPVIILAITVGGLVVWLLCGTGTGSSQSSDDVLNHEHRLLLEGAQHYPMPYALYDENDRLLVWNGAYEAIYARTFARLSDKLGARQLKYAELVRDNASETLAGAELEDYVNCRVAEQRRPGGGVFDREYPGLGWFRVSKHITPSGGVAGYAIDINELKRREADLMSEVERRKRLEVRIRKIANTDELTGVANRRHFIDRASDAFARAIRKNTPMCLLVIDVDHFKQVNDTFGHAAGDETLATMANAAGSVLENGEALLGRLGGEEFGVLAPQSGLAAGLRLAEEICNTARTLSFLIDGREFSITVSIGVAERSGVDQSVADLLKRADDALYLAKTNGRDRVERALAVVTPDEDARSLASLPARRAMR